MNSGEPVMIVPAAARSRSTASADSTKVVEPVGPTAATHMDKFVERLLGETGLLAMIGRAERGPAAIQSMRRHGAAYLVAVGGAA